MVPLQEKHTIHFSKQEFFSIMYMYLSKSQSFMPVGHFTSPQPSPQRSHDVRKSGGEWMLLIDKETTSGKCKVRAMFFHFIFKCANSIILMFAPMLCGCSANLKNIWVRNRFYHSLRGFWKVAAKSSPTDRGTNSPGTMMKESWALCLSPCVLYQLNVFSWNIQLHFCTFLQ